MKLNKNQLLHLFNRTSYGIPFGDLKTMEGNSKGEVIKKLIKEDHFNAYFNIIPTPEISPQEIKMLSEVEKKMLNEMAMDKLQKLNVHWVKYMISEKSFPNLFREKMAVFWHGHFACRERNPYLAQKYLNTIRKHALGNFKDLLFEVSKEPAMLKFLNNQQNKKQSPNENFAREVMELFTLGRGNYSEEDIKNAARAFTGWSFNKNGEFVIRKKQHDESQKNFLGQKGNFNGDDILDIILQQKETANFISRKVYQHFVSEHVDENHLKELSDYFYESHYDIALLMEKILKSEWFYEERNKGNLIKSPIDFLVQFMKTYHVEFDSEESYLILQKMLGQTLLYPPNVAGWPGGKTWIDSSTLMLRLRIPEVILRLGELKEEEFKFPQGMKPKGKFKKLAAQVDWDAFLQEFEDVKDKDLQNEISEYLIPNALPKGFLPEYSGDRNRTFKESAFLLTQLPDFQLC